MHRPPVCTPPGGSHRAPGSPWSSARGSSWRPAMVREPFRPARVFLEHALCSGTLDYESSDAELRRAGSPRGVGPRRALRPPRGRCPGSPSGSSAPVPKPRSGAGRVPRSERAGATTSAEALTSWLFVMARTAPDRLRHRGSGRGRSAPGREVDEPGASRGSRRLRRDRVEALAQLRRPTSAIELASTAGLPERDRAWTGEASAPEEPHDRAR